MLISHALSVASRSESRVVASDAGEITGSLGCENGREWIAQFFARESTEIPQEVYDTLWSEIKKNRITDMKMLTNKRMREFLKKHRLNKYYEHINFLLHKMCSTAAPPTISKANEERLCNAFKQIQGPFAESHHAKSRRNFLSYSFVLYKLSQLFELDDLTPHFNLLKSREKLQKQDEIWGDICKKLNWEHVSTVY